MPLLRVVIACILAVVPVLQDTSLVRPGPPKVCASCAGWNQPLAPFRIFGNTYYVGVGGLSALVVATNAGLILLDGALPQSAPIIDTHIRELGFRTADVKLIVTSHTHFDHVGGVAALQRATGAVVAASPAAARALQAGEPLAEDPQAGDAASFPRVGGVRVIADGESLRVGDVAIVAHFTPGHTPGGTTWTWRACEAARCLDVVYADSLNAVSNEGFHFTRQPGLIGRFRRSIASVAALPCDVLISVHPEFIDLAGKLARRMADPASNPFIDATACRAYAAAATRLLDARIAAESGEARVVER